MFETESNASATGEAKLALTPTPSLSPSKLPAMVCQRENEFAP